MASAGIFRRKIGVGRIAICAFVIGLCGCTFSDQVTGDIDKRGSEAKQSLDAAKPVPDHGASYDPLTVSNKVWNGSVALRMRRGVPLPARYESPRGVTLVAADPMSIEAIANAISAQTGIPVRLSSMTAGKSAKPAAAASSFDASLGGAPTMPDVGGDASNSSDNMPVSYEGSLSGLMERVSAYYGVSWRYDGSAITISKYETRVFSIEALPGTEEIKEGMQDDQSSSGGSSGGSGGGSSSGGGTSSTNTLTQNSKFSMDFKYWDELSIVLKSMIGTQGSVVISPSIGTVTVTTTPEVMASISDYLAKENTRMSRQIAINVQIYSVNLGQSEDFSLAFTSVLDNLSKSHLPNIGFNSVSGQATLAPTITNSAITSSASLGSVSVAILNGNGANASDLFNALSSIGDTSSVAQFPMVTLNNRPVSRRVGTDTNYVSAITSNTTATTSTTTVYTPTISTIHDGFSLQLTPRVLDDGRILLQYSLNLTGKPQMPTSSISGNTITLPITQTRLFVQQSMLRSGQTLVIGGVDQEDLTQNRQGVGSPDNFLLGGGVSSDKTHYMMFMAITPQILDVVANEEHN